MGIPVNFEARMVDDAELRFTPAGVGVASFRVAASDRKKNEQTGQWEDGDTVFLSCSAWRDMSENVCEHLRKGQLVLISGKLKQRSYETKEGEKRTVYEVAVDNIGPSLKWKDKTGGTVSRPQVSNGGYDDQVPF